MLKDELWERYKQTGRIGFCTPKNMDEACHLIHTITKLYEEENNPIIEETEEVVISLSELTNKMKEFFENFN